MSLEFKKCLEKGKIKPFPQGERLVSKEINSAKKDLKWAKISFEDQNYKWATIQAYFSMFHAARALLYSKGYRERSHYCLIEAIKALFVEKNLLELKLVEDFHTAMVLRENADYQEDFSKEGALKIIESSKEFSRKLKSLLGKIT